MRAATWIAAAAYGALLVVASHGGFPEQSPTGTRMPYLADKPIGEDGYYMLTVAWYLGHGQGLEYNLGAPTTGIQPLSTVVYGGVAALVQMAGGDRWTFARVMLAVGIAQWLALAWAIGRVAATLRPASHAGGEHDIAPLAAMLALLSYNIFRMSAYGLETAIYLMCFAACVRLSLMGTRSITSAIVMGIVCGVTALARIDFLVVLAVFLAIQILRGRLFWLPSIVTGVTAILVTSPWFAVVYAMTGHPMPTSGRAQLTWPAAGQELLTRLSHMGDALSQHLSPWLYAPAAHAAITSVAGTAALNPVLSLAIGLAGAFVAWQGWRALTDDTRRTLGYWLVALAVLCAVYVARFAWVFFFERYTAPLLVLTIPLLALGLVRIVRDARVLTAVPAVMLAGFAVSAWVTLHMGRVGNANSLNAGFVARHLPPPTIVGTYQSGTVGFFNPNVVNLDGKMNAAVLEAVATNTFADYIDAAGITHLVDWPEVARAPSPFSTWQDCGLGGVGYSACFVRPNR